MPGQLEGEVAFVTGAGRGIGRAIAVAYAAEGAAVALMARSKDQLEDAVREISSAGGKAIVVAGDVTKAADVSRAASEAASRLGVISLLVSNAGITGPFAPIWDADPDEWWRTQEVHLHGAFLCTRAVYPGMVERGGGRIIIVSSRAAERGAPYGSAYGIAKAAQLRFTESLAAEGAEAGIRAFVLHPGLVDTQFADEPLERADALRWRPDFVARLKQLKQDPSSGNPVSQVADLCVFLGSGRGDALSGRYLSVDYDWAELAKQAERIREQDLYTLRLRTLEQPAGPPPPATPPSH
jgi:NAD(P)-dependent dehydrogenase (short-subunit alcohol dehydrogenase family)